MQTQFFTYSKPRDLHLLNELYSINRIRGSFKKVLAQLCRGPCLYKIGGSFEDLLDVRPYSTAHYDSRYFTQDVLSDYLSNSGKHRQKRISKLRMLRSSDFVLDV